MRAVRQHERHGIRRLVLSGVAVAIAAGYITAGGALIGALSATTDRAVGSTLPKSSLVVEAPVSNNGLEPAKGYSSQDIARVAATKGVASVSGFGSHPIALMKSSQEPFLGNADAFAVDPANPVEAKLATGALPLLPMEVTLDKTTSERIGVSVGQRLLVKGSDGQVKSLTVVGITQDGGTPITSYGAVVGMATSDYLWAAGPNSLDAMLVNTAAGSDLKQVRAALAGDSAGGSVTSNSSWASTQRGKNSSIATEATILFGIAAVVVVGIAAAAVSTTLRVSLASRLREAGLLRAIGASGQQLRKILFRQALAIGVIGSVVGVGVGYAAAALTSAVVSATLGSGAVTIPGPSVGYAIAGVVVGVLVTLFGVMRPAREAMRTSPVEAVVDSEVSEADLTGVARRGRIQSKILFAIGMVCLVLSLGGNILVLFAPIGGIFLSMSFSRSAVRFVGVVARRLPRRKGSTLGLAADSVQRLPMRSGKLAALVATSTALIGTLVLVGAAMFSMQSSTQLLDKMAAVSSAPSQTSAVVEAVKANGHSLYAVPSNEPGITYVGSSVGRGEAESPVDLADVHIAVSNVAGTSVYPANQLTSLQPDDGSGGLLSALLAIVGSLAIGTGVLTGVVFVAASISSLRARAGELGVLRAIGMTRRRMVRMVTIEGGLVGFVGAVGGAAIAVVVAGVAFLPTGMPFGALGLLLVGGVVVGATAAATLGTFWPAWLQNRRTVMPASGVE